MDFLNQDQIEVTSPVTIDGTHPKYDSGGKLMYKKTLLPITAKKHIERQNQNLPDHLKKKIEVLKWEQPVEDKGSTQTAATFEPIEDGKPNIAKKRFNQIGATELKKW